MSFALHEVIYDFCDSIKKMIKIEKYFKNVLTNIIYVLIYIHNNNKELLITYKIRKTW